MRKGNDVIGKLIIAYDTGEQVGKVTDVLLDLGRNQLLGIALSEGKDLPPSPGVPLADVQALGADAVIIASRMTIQPLDQHNDSLRRLRHDLQRKPLSLFTTDGRNLGTLGDVYFDERSGEIHGYEVTGGAFAAASFGKSFVPASQQVKVGAEILFVPAETVTLMNASESELPAAPISQGEAEPEAQKLFTAAAPSLLSVPQTVEETRGRRVRCTVRTDDGLIIAAQGQIVTDAVIEQARVHHTEQALKEAVVQTAEQQATGGNDLSLLDRTRERVREETSHLVANTEKVWDQVKGTVTDLVHRGKKHRTEQDSVTHAPTTLTSPPPEQAETDTHPGSNRHP